MNFDAKEMGKRIRQVRMDMGCTQEEFAELLMISREFMGKIERGTRVPSLELLFEFRHKTGTSLDYIIYGEESSRNEELNYVKERIREVMVILEKVK